MKLAIMQPYFFPYIGYWQLIAASDVFVLLDDVQFIRGGWIERNRVLNPKGGWQYVGIPLAPHPHTEAIRNVRAREGADWKRRLLAQISHYRRLAPFYREAREAIEGAIRSADSRGICAINAAIIKEVCRAIGLERTFRVASESGFDYSEVRGPGDWALQISRQMGAHTYINPVSGAGLFEPVRFQESGISLRFLESEPVAYPRRNEFIPQLSIIDVLMFNGIDGTRSLLQAHRLVEPALG